MSPDELAGVATGDPTRLLLAGEVIEAAMRTVLDEKLAALADALANGVTATGAGALDREFVFVRALSDVEAGHLRVLDKMVTEDVWGHPARPRAFPMASLPGWELRELREKLVDVADLIPAVLATLERHALVEVVPVDWVKETNQAMTGWSHGGKDPKWRGTELGEWFLERVRRADSSQLPPPV